jgi:hypothetical protein
MRCDKRGRCIKPQSDSSAKGPLRHVQLGVVDHRDAESEKRNEDCEGLAIKEDLTEDKFINSALLRARIAHPRSKLWALEFQSDAKTFRNKHVKI